MEAMKYFIFFTSDGFTEDKNNNQNENCQILGWVGGINPDDAFKKLKIEINFENMNFDKVSCQELQSEKVCYFSLND